MYWFLIPFWSTAHDLMETVPAPARTVLIGVVNKLAISAGKSGLSRLRAYFLPTVEERARQRALATAAARALQDCSELQAVGFAEAITRSPFAELITRLLDAPNTSLDRDAVTTAFEASIYDLPPLGIDVFEFIEAVRRELLEALRLGDSSAAREIHAGVRLEQLTTSVDHLIAVVGIAVPPGDEPFMPRVEEALAVYNAGQIQSALRLWTRLRTDTLSSLTSPYLRARVHNNIAACHLDLGHPEDALPFFRLAVEYAPDSALFVANMAQCELAMDQPDAALRNAGLALRLDPTCRNAWFVRIQSSDEPVAAEDIPEVLRLDSELLVARAFATAPTNRPAAIELLRDAIRRGARSPLLLIVLAEFIYSTLFPRRTNGPVPADQLIEIKRLADEAVEALQEQERPSWLARAYTLLGAVEELGENGDGEALYVKALATDPTSVPARMANAQAQIHRRDGRAALYLLAGVSEAARPVRWYALHSGAAVLAGESTAIDADISAVIDAAPDEERLAAAVTVAGNAIRARRLERIGDLLVLLDRPESRDMLALYRARIAIVRGDSESAIAAFEDALVQFPPQSQGEVHLEYASFLFGQMRYEDAIVKYDASGKIWDDPRAVREYGIALLHLHRHASLDGLLARLGAHEGRPLWALDVESHLARSLNDVPRELLSLAELLRRRPDDVGTRSRLAHVLLRSGERVRAAETIAPLSSRGDLDAIDAINTALLLVQLEQFELALTQAYLAMRQAPELVDVQRAAINGVFFATMVRGGMPLQYGSREQVEADTWVQLEGEAGEPVTYLILSQGRVDARRNEILVDDPRVAPLMGKRVGETVRFQEGGLHERVFRISELKSAQIHEFQDTALRFQTRYQDNSIVAYDTTDGREVTSMIRALGAGQEHSAEIWRRYAEGRLPLGVLTHATGHSILNLYTRLIRAGNARIFVEEPGSSSYSVSPDSTQARLVLTASAVASLSRLARLDLLAALYVDILLPQSLLDEINEELAALEASISRGGEMNSGFAGGLVQADTVPTEVLCVWRDELQTARTSLLAMAQVTPRLLRDGPDEDERTRTVLGDATYDALVLAREGAILYADDWGLQNLSREQGAAKGASTYALLQMARAANLIDATGLRHASLQLIEIGHVVIPVDGDMLYETLAERGFTLDTTARRVLAAALDSDRPRDLVIDVVVQLLRRLALSSLGRAAVAPVTTIALTTMMRGDDFRETLRQFLNAAHAALQYLPSEHAVVIDSARRATVNRYVGGMVQRGIIELP